MSEVSTIKEVVEFPDGVAILGKFGCPEVTTQIKKYCESFPLIIWDPPYGNVAMANWDRFYKDDQLVDVLVNNMRLIELEKLVLPGGSLYMFGGIGKPWFRPFQKAIPIIEEQSKWCMLNHITWKKRRGFGKSWDYLFTREEIFWFVLSEVRNRIVKPIIFNKPYLNKIRGYAGWNKKYPAKNDFLRRSNVWDDVTEIFHGKIHYCQKPDQLVQIPVSVHTNKEDWVLDPMAGSGVTARAARHLERRWIIVEQDEEMFAKALRTLK